MRGPIAGLAALSLLTSVTVARAQGAAQRVSVPGEYGLALATASPVMQYASDVTFDNGQVKAAHGVSELGRGATPPAPPASVSTTVAPLVAGAWYAVDDGQSHTYLLEVVSSDPNGTTVELEPSARQMAFGAAGQPNTAPAYGEVATPKYGEVATPKYGEVATPKFGSVAMPHYGSVATPRFGYDTVPSHAAPEPAAQQQSAAAPPPPAPRDTTPPPPPPPPLPPLKGRHIAMTVFRLGGGGSSATTYYFHRDGSFQRHWVFHSYMGGNESDDRGEYAIQGHTLILRIGGSESASVGGYGATAGQSSTVKEERHRIVVRGSSLVIDGKLFERSSSND